MGSRKRTSKEEQAKIQAVINRTQGHAVKHSVQSSPRKMRIVLDMIRGKRVPEALSILHFTPNHASVVAEKTLRSAIANFQMKPEHSNMDVEDLYVRECSADGGVMLKRVLPAPQGRAYRVRKRSHHLRIVIGDTPTVRGAARNAKTSKRERAKTKEASKAGQLSTSSAKS